MRWQPDADPGELVSMKMIRQAYPPIPNATDSAVEQSTTDRLFAELDADGIVVLPNLLSAEHLRGMQKAFDTRLRRMRWNNFDGYHKTELYRHMVEDVLILDQGFVDLALHP